MCRYASVAVFVACKPFPASLVPLIDWIQETTKSVKQRKLQSLKNTKAVDCWLGKH
jgi:hypothetical protein